MNRLARRAQVNSGAPDAQADEDEEPAGAGVTSMMSPAMKPEGTHTNHEGLVEVPRTGCAFIRSLRASSQR